MPDTAAMKFLEAGLDVIVAVVTIAVTYGLGRLFTDKWDLHQKRREQNLESVRALHDLYGEFKEVLKIWRVAKDKKKPISISSEERWDLLKRACSVEGKTEALVMRLAAERNLGDDQPEQIGMFRQAIQSLRQSIRDDKSSPLGDRGVEYDLMNELAPRVSSIVTKDLPRTEPDVERAKRQLAGIVAVRSEDWKKEVATRKAKLTKAAARTKPQSTKARNVRPNGA